MTEQEIRKNVVGLEVPYLGMVKGDERHRFICDVYNLHQPLPRGIRADYTMKYCAIQQSAVFQMEQMANLIPFEMGCYEMWQGAKKMGIWHGVPFTPQIGDLIMYDWFKDNGKGKMVQDGQPDHVEIVETVENGVLTCIGGNNSGGVCSRRTIALTDNQILGFICPDFASIADGAPEPEPEPVSGFPWYGIVQTQVNLRTSPQNLGPLNWCNIEAPTGSPIRHTLKQGETVKIIGESGNWWQTEITGRYTWTPFIAKTSGGKDIVKPI